MDKRILMIRFFFISLPMLWVPLPPAAAGSYFLVAESEGSEEHGDSFVIYLEKPEHIDHARGLIEHGRDFGQPIVLAQIEKGPDAINRDYKRPGAPSWSWRVTGVTGFADITMEILDGWPTFVESDVDGWIENTNGAIGFWSYTVVKELQSVPTLVATELGPTKVSLLVDTPSPPRTYNLYSATEIGGEWSLIDSFEASSATTLRTVELPEDGSQVFFSVSTE